jgi:mRNA-decapping enzyme subunit 2
LADLTKPFSPKVLRRPDKDNLDAYLPTHTVEVSAFSRPDEESTAEEQKEEPRQLNYDRRPSQPTSQKQALLSLFGKSSPSTAVFAGSREESRPSVSPPPVASPLRSTVISPLVSSASPVPRTQPLAQPPTSAAKPSSPIISPPPAPTMTKDRARLTSPVDKAFLLGYLEGVAKGNR